MLPSANRKLHLPPSPAPVPATDLPQYPVPCYLPLIIPLIQLPMPAPPANPLDALPPCHSRSRPARPFPFARPAADLAAASNRELTAIEAPRVGVAQQFHRVVPRLDRDLAGPLFDRHFLRGLVVGALDQDPRIGVAERTISSPRSVAMRMITVLRAIMAIAAVATSVPTIRFVREPAAWSSFLWLVSAHRPLRWASARARTPDPDDRDVPSPALLS